MDFVSYMNNIAMFVFAVVTIICGRKTFVVISSCKYSGKCQVLTKIIVCF